MTFGSIYITSLEFGENTIQEIAKKSQLSRSTTYEIVKFLVTKRLMSTLTKGKKRYYVAELPERLLSFIENKQKELEDRKKEIKALIPELHDLIKLSKNRPKVRFYETKQGIRAIQEDILKTKNIKSIEEFVPLDDAYQLFPPHARDHRHKMAGKIKIPEKVIYTSRKGAILPLKKGYIERHFIPISKFPFHSEITIYADKVAIVSFKEKLVGVLVESEDIANALRCMFNLLWSSLKKSH